jgi:hypothetical protein
MNFNSNVQTYTDSIENSGEVIHAKIAFGQLHAIHAFARFINQRG